MGRETKEQKQARARKVLSILKRTYPKAKIILKSSNPWELLVAVVLSAQSTDAQVIKVTDRLFKKYRTLDDYVNVSPKEFEKDIYSTGFYRQKTKHILAAAKRVKEVYGGTVPQTMEGLTTLPGVARKTANIVLGNAFGVVEGIAVDTHVRRLSGRLGFSAENNPEKIERDLMALFPKTEWLGLTYFIIDHGRAVCMAKDPRCDLCPLKKFCPSAYKFPRFQ